jgi:hypothetical protein
MNLLIIGDIHTKHEKAERICQYYPDHRIIFIGDYFDQFFDSPECNADTALWLKQSLKNPNRVHLRGNHDECYDPRVGVYCSGFSVEKKKAINEILSIDDWDCLKYFHYEYDWWFSHAGLTMDWHVHPMLEGPTTGTVQHIINDAITQQRSNSINNAIWASSYARGGSNKVGGILWEDWRDLKLISGVKQVVGHTPLDCITVIEDKDLKSININVDSSAYMVYHTEVLEIHPDGSFNVLDTAGI